MLTLQQKGWSDDNYFGLHEVELTLTLEEPRVGDNLQVWFYRYDCIVNSEYPDIALELTNVLIKPARFNCN